MKKSTFFLICMGLLVCSSFIDKPKYPADVSEDVVSLWESEFIEIINNEALNTTMETYFVRFFDDVESIDVQFSKAGEYYYYIVFGTKNKQDVIQLMKIEKDDYLNQTYTYIDFSKVKDLNSVELCYEGALCPVCTYDRCCWSCSTVCGLWDGFNCSI